MSAPLIDPPSSASAFGTAAALTLGAVVLWGAWQMAGSLPVVASVPSLAWHTAKVRTGELTAAWGTALDKHLPQRDGLIALANGTRYVLTGGADAQVRVGRDEWLYLAEEFTYHPGGVAALQARAQLLADVQQVLAAKGVRLVVALVPDKARVHPEHLSRVAPPLWNQERFGQALMALKARGVVAVDLDTPLRAAAPAAPQYYRTDTHWNQAGARVAARAVADVVQRVGGSLDAAEFSTQPQGASQARPGDLLRLMGLAKAPDAVRPTPDAETTEATVEVNAKLGGLLDSSAVPVVLVGTSYSLRANFHGYLQQALGAKVLNAAKDGGGFLSAAGDYFKDESFASAPPQVLVWELPERFLTQPLGQESGWLKQVGLR